MCVVGGVLIHVIRRKPISSRLLIFDYKGSFNKIVMLFGMYVIKYV